MHCAHMIFFVLWIWLFLADPNFWILWGYFVFNILMWVKYHFQYFIASGDLVCLRATTWWWRRWGKEATIDWGPPACMSRIIHFLGKEKKNLIDIVSMKVPSAPLSKNVSSAVRRTIGWQGNGRCGLNETVLIEIRTSVGFATVQTPWPCHR